MDTWLFSFLAIISRLSPLMYNHTRTINPAFEPASSGLQVRRSQAGIIVRERAWELLLRYHNDCYNSYTVAVGSKQDS